MQLPLVDTRALRLNAIPWCMFLGSVSDIDQL